MKHLSLVIISCLLNTLNSFSQVVEGSLLLENVVIHTSGGIIEKGVIGIMGDSIVLAADSRLIKFNKAVYEKVENLEGAHAWPGFIALNSTIGLREVDAVRATLDYAEVGLIKPHVRTLTAYNTDSKIIPTVRSNGILLVQASPKAGMISGSSSLFNLEGWNWEDAVVKSDDGIHLNWPSMSYALSKADTSKRDNKENERLHELNVVFRDAIAYQKEPIKEKKNLILEALQPVLDGSSALYIHANKSRDVQDAVYFAKKYGVKRPVIVGCDDCATEIPLLKENNIPVVLSRLHRLPEKPDMHPSEVFELPAKLISAGITVALSYEGDMEAMGTRNLPFTAGTAQAYGLSETEALNLISLNPAKIVGMESKLGSIEAGKKANFFINKGNALDMRTGGADRIFIQGVEVSTDNSQKLLYRTYLNKYKLN